MKRLNISLPSSCHLYAIALLLGLLVLKHVFYIAFIGLFYYIIRKNKQKYAICLVMLFSMGYQYIRTTVHLKANGEYIILAKEHDQYIGYSHYRKYIIYSTTDLDVGDIIYTTSAVVSFDYDQFDGDFDANSYYKSKGIYGYLKAPKLEVIGHRFVPHSLIEQIKVYLDTLPNDSKDFVKSLVFGAYDFEEKAVIGHLGLSHLFVLSGLHVNVIILVLGFGFKPLSKRHKLIAYYIFLTFYLFITAFPVSLLRAVTQYLIYETLMIKQKPYTRLDALSLSFIGLFIYNPALVYQLGFILSFIISLFFVLEPPEKGFFSLFKHTLFVQLLVLPFISTFQDTFYPISFLIAPVFMVGFSYVILPMAWVALVKPLAIFLNDSFYGIKWVLIWVEKDQIGLSLPHISGIYLVGYLVLWVYFYIGYIKQKQLYRMVWLLIYILVIPNLSWIKYQTTVTFLDVGQGDTTLIDSPNCTILIDTYGDIYTYLRTKHLDALDYLIITHGDYDHYKEVFTVMDHIAVDQLIINAYESGQFYDEIKNRYPYTKVSSGDEIRCGPIVLDVLGPIQAYSNKNNQSIVLKTYINGTHYLFAGDIEVEAEKDLSEKYGTTLKSDILKVPHHGSNTSSSLLFLNYVSPKIAVISAGRQNKFNHPHESILKRYHELGIQIYQTKLNYTITIASHRDKKYMVLVHK